MLCDRPLSFFHSFCHSVNKITDERGNGRRPNLAWARGDLKWLTFGGDPDLRVNSGFSFPSPLRNRPFFDICYC